MIVHKLKLTNFKQYQNQDIEFLEGLSGIIGRNGSGKTTLLKILYREIFPTEGQIVIDSRNILKIPNHRIFGLRRSMGIVFQDFKNLFHHF